MYLTPNHPFIRSKHRLEVILAHKGRNFLFNYQINSYFKVNFRNHHHQIHFNQIFFLFLNVIQVKFDFCIHNDGKIYSCKECEGYRNIVCKFFFVILSVKVLHKVLPTHNCLLLINSFVEISWYFFIDFHFYFCFLKMELKR